MSFLDLYSFAAVVEDPIPIQVERAVGYASLETVWKSLKDWGFSVDEYAKIPYSEGEYKAWVSGQLTEKSSEQQDFLRTMFDLKFSGSPANPRMLIHFQVRRDLP